MEEKAVYEVDMPETNAPKMVKITFAVPEELHQQILDLASAEGWKPAELHRVVWVLGFNAYAEGSNKRLVNRNLRSKSAKQVSE
ncbi:MAG: hypothetical protein RM049_26710 [Nostoc sp. DedQUE04]|uniref:hypothetical protein n=1 Tax=Nostoc sp. DedQUE04 TaxID=3075390 RepID=UPI002AD2A6B6|nr:hypothetical protein [Nostoc sp. DedQUE04]MDZ8138852.1 hypothetical protein [Nostoc sp. DedQUE04]